MIGVCIVTYNEDMYIAHKLIINGYKIKYSELLIKIDEFARGLYSDGVRRGDIVTICLPNTIEGIVSFFAINKIGAIVNFIHPSSSENEIRDSLNETNSKILLITDANYIKIKNIENDIKVNRIILIDIYGYTPTVSSIRDKLDEKIETNFLKTEKLYIFWNFFLIKARRKKIVFYNRTNEELDHLLKQQKQCI